MAEFLTTNMGVNETGNLTVSGVDMVALAKEYGTPLYVMDETMIRTVCRKFRDSISRYYQGNGLVCYASKAFSCKEIYRIMKSEGIGIDAVSIGELYTAFSVDFPAEHICFHGNNKTEEELRYAVEKNVGRIIVDNLTELENLDRIAGEMGKKPGVMFRIKPGIDAHTHDFIRTGQIDSKFGFALETGEAMAAVKEAVKLEHLELKGLHCHIGSQIFDIDPFEAAAEVMLKFIAQIKAETGLEIKELNLGGGFGIKYTQTDKPSDYDCYMERVSEVVKRLAEKLDLPVPFIYLFARKILLWGKDKPVIGRFFTFCLEKGERGGQKLQAKAGRGLFWALLLFVGIPLPGTGAWTGTLAASLLDMGFKKSVLACMGGVLLAGCIMGILSVLGVSAFGAVVQ